MKQAVLTSVLCNYSFEDALKILNQKGISHLQLSCGGNEGDNHCPASELLMNDKTFQVFMDLLEQYQMSVDSLCCYVNPLHPQKEVREQADNALKNAVLLAEKMGIKVVCTTSGCPGSEKKSVYPHWCSTVHPAEPVVTLNTQWVKWVKPYWTETGQFAKKHNVELAINLVPGNVVYNPDSFRRLVKETGYEFKVCLDPSNLVWLKMDLAVLCKKLKGQIAAVIANDIYIDEDEVGRNGVFDPFGDNEGHHVCVAGNGQVNWNLFVTQLILSGYKGNLTVDHHDVTIGQLEGLQKAIECISGVIHNDERIGCEWRKSLKGDK